MNLCNTFPVVPSEPPLTFTEAFKWSERLIKPAGSTDNDTALNC